MDVSLQLTMPEPASVLLPAFKPSARLPDESLAISAMSRWRQSREGLREMLAATPGMRDTLNHRFKEVLDLDGERTGLLFPATDLLPERFISFTNVCAFVLQYSQVEKDLNQQCRVSGLPQAHPLQALQPEQWFERLKMLGMQQAHAQRWRAFWDSRAPGTAVSRREHVQQLYRLHFEACAHLAYAHKTLSAEQLKLVQLVIDPPPGALMMNAQPVYTEQLAMVLKDERKVMLSGAWVIRAGADADAAPLLYLPCRAVAIQAFAQRSDMQAWLLEQSLVPTGLPTDDIRFEYTVSTDALELGAHDLLAHRQQSQVTLLTTPSRREATLADDGGQSLAQVDRVDQQRSHDELIAAPPSPTPPLPPVDDDDDAEADEQALFGSLFADIPWPLRQAALNRQREALEARMADVGESPGLQSFKDSLKALESAEQAGYEAATALLYRARTSDLQTFQREFTALHAAHKAGLQAECALQQALGQLDEDDCNRLRTVLDALPVAGSDTVVASITLTMSTEVAGQTTLTTQELPGVWVVTQAAVLSDPTCACSLLLYWPGTGGGLQRYAGLGELARQVFKIDPADRTLTLQLKQIRDDVLVHGLNQLTSEFEEQAAMLRQRHAASTDAGALGEALDSLRTKTLARLQVPVHAARSLAFAHLLEQSHSATLVSHLPDWLKTMAEADRLTLKKLIEAYMAAMGRSHEIMTLLLEPRDDFTRKRLHARLSKDFALTGSVRVQLDLPDTTKWQSQFYPAPGAPMTPEKLVLVPSAARSKMSLEELAQTNIDNTPSMQLEPLALRLAFMKVEVSTREEAERLRLTSGITLDYLKQVLPELNLPHAYEQLIRDTFNGPLTESAFARAQRRECLVEPWRLMLRLQGECARLQRHIGSDDLLTLNIAIDANTAQAWRTDGKRVVLLPAYLSAGGKDTPYQLSVALSGVTFIQEQVSGVTLLYLPDSPDGQFLRRYDSLEAARKGLFNLSVVDKWNKYLAGRTLQGNVRAHENRLNQAWANRYDAMIGVGLSWPATTSLSEHLLDAHMGRLIEAHRGTSRSNDALYLERYALKGPRAFNYIKMAVGLVPFVGTVLSLYDAWTAANQAVAAFLRGEIGDGLSELRSVLTSLIDAAMDLLPGEMPSSTLSRTARQLTRTRQLRRLARHAAALKGTSQREARQVVQRFKDYEYELPISLAGLQPATHGLYRGIYRHADGDFIVRQGRIFEVQRSQDSRNWRLVGNSRKTYKQPIALDESGQWDTWFGVYGTTFEGGGLGGGQVLGHMADALDPLWPQAIRQQLPRWWVDHAFRRHHRLAQAAEGLGDQIQARNTVSNAAINRYNDAAAKDRPALVAAAETACLGDIELAKRAFQTLDELIPLTSGNKKQEARLFRSKTAWQLTDRYHRVASYTSRSVLPITNRIDELTQALNNLPGNNLAPRIALLEEIRLLRLQYLSKLDRLEKLKIELNLWNERIQVRADKLDLASDVNEINSKHSDASLLYLRTSQRLETVKRYGRADDVSWFYLLGQAHELRIDVDRALYTQYILPTLTATPAQRSRILQNCVDLYSRFRLEMNIWTHRYPQHFHLDQVEPLLNGIEQLGERARRGIIAPAQAAPAGQSAQRVFTTADNQLLYGVERWEPTTQTRQYVSTGRGGHEEIWQQGNDGQFRLLNPRPVEQQAPANLQLPALLTEARQRLATLPAYQTRVQAYAEQNMLPVNLEHMLVSEAAELTRRADRIAASAPQEPVIEQLRDQAAQLITSGRAMRTRQSLVSRAPTDGMLLDLISENAVEIRRNTAIRNLGRRDGRTDYMQEYEVWNLTSEPAGLLWYAHFHYRSATPVFGTFEKAHLKLPEHRFLTHADDATLPYANIGRQSAVLEHFQALAN
ncbi:dermonecrotic toxin domain-containing protein [Pseudomonas fluorescens]|uniref:dermonecrotic toxin domain-containing protein n=1 Tax=Pseudomonas fluorescens TaxID=294 RepID=UPI00123F5262|nr:DUF6543 domain-containing protein [Pseudomonas fluorescens]VVO75341.1 hypothetical protein PS898_01520 [Pseudomonas fluorescens]